MGYLLPKKLFPFSPAKFRPPHRQQKHENMTNNAKTLYPEEPSTNEKAQMKSERTG